MGVAAAQAGQRLLIGQQDAAFACGDILGDLEAEGRASSDRTGTLAIEQAPPGVRRVFENLKAMPCGDVGEVSHVRKPSGDMNGNDRFGARRNLALDLDWIEAQCVRLDVSEYGNSANGYDGAGGGDEGIRRDDDFIAGQHADAS